MASISSRIVEICVFKATHDEPTYLLLKRSASETLYPGIWQIVTGVVEGDEHAVSTALRELREETALRPKRLWIVPYVDVFYSAPTDTVITSPVFAVEVAESDEPKLSAEHQEFRWCLYREAKELAVWRGQKAALKRVQNYVEGGLKSGTFVEIKDFSRFERNAP